MEKGYNLYNLEPEFKNFLLAEKISPVSLKNYLSDFRHFAGWLILKLKVKNEKLKIEDGAINHALIEEYKSYLIENNLPHKTVNRRLSTIRKFCSFCISQGWMKENPAKKIANVRHPQGVNILQQFKEDLEKENIDPQTINSYLDDVREFLSL